MVNSLVVQRPYQERRKPAPMRKIHRSLDLEFSPILHLLVFVWLWPCDFVIDVTDLEDEHQVQ